ncbi:MAG TPA: hypothetical protein VGL93_14510 [Streptosporangiaceae bacterium]
MLLLGSAIALRLTVEYMRPILPWLLGGIVLAATVLGVVAVVRWHQSRF